MAKIWIKNEAKKKAKKPNYLEKVTGNVGRLFAELHSQTDITEEAVATLVKKISVESFKNGIEVGQKKKTPVRRKK